MPATLARDRLAQHLRQARRAAGLSGTELARRLGWDQPRVSRTERCVRLPSVEALQAWAQATGTDPEELLTLRRRAVIEYETFQQRYAETGGADRLQDRIAAAEAASTRIAMYCPTMILGVVQTPAYAHETLQLPPGAVDAGVGEEEIGRIVAARLRRQAILYEPGRQITLVMGEAALRHRYTSVATMRDQLLHLARLAETLTTATIGIVPFTADLPLVTLHGWTVLDDMVTIEHADGDLDIADPERVNRYLTWTDMLVEHSLTGAEAAELTRGLAEELPQS